MANTTWKPNGNHPASLDVRSLSILVFLTLLLSACLGSIRAADEPSQLSPLTSSLARSTLDVEIEARVLRALRRDPELGPLNLGVHMSGGIAKLSGPIPAAGLRTRAVRIVQTIDGVREVSTKDLYISHAASGRKRMSIVIQNDQPTQTRAASPHSPANPRSFLTDTATSPPVLSAQAPSKEADYARNNSQISLLAPEIAAPPKRAPERASLTANPRPASPGVAIASSIEQLRRNDPRYHQIRSRVEGTTVYLVPGETSGEDAMMFAQAVRRLTGVQHVVIVPGSR